MAHRSRSEQLSHGVKARKDPKGLAKKTKRHTPKTAYKRKRRFFNDIDGWYTDD